MPVSESLKEELAVAIAKGRGGSGAGDMAQQLLKRDGGGRELVGVLEGAKRAVFYSPATWGCHSVEFDENRCDGLSRKTLGKFTHHGELERWLADQDPDGWAWLHPRYRWLLENPNNE